MRSTFASALLALTLLTPSLAHAAMALDGKPKVAFFATGSPGFMSIEGDTSTMTLTDDGTKLTFTVPMSTVESGIPLRDEHMNNNYVQVDKFPNAVIEFARADVAWPTEVGKSVDTKVKAAFTAHGVTLPTEIAANITKTKTGYRVKGRFDFNTTAHGMLIEPYMGISFDPNMYATVTMDLLDAP